MATVTLKNEKTGKTKRLQLAGALGITQEIELNIGYGDTAPEDTSKLWVKTAVPSNVMVTNDIASGENDLVECSTTLPVAMNAINAAAVGKKIYLFGGYDGSSKFNTIRVFDTGTDTITTLDTTLPAASYMMDTAVVGKKIYLFGGLDGINPGTYKKTIYVFDTGTNTPTTLSATLPTVSNSIGIAAVGEKIYLFGGANKSSYLNTILVFDTGTDTITTLSTTLPAKTSGIGTAAVGEKIYLFGGYVGSRLNTIRVFYNHFPLPTGQMILRPTTAENVFTLIRTNFNTVELGVIAAYIGNAEGYAESVPAALYTNGAWVELT